MYSFNRTLKAFRWLLVGTPPERRRVQLELARVSASLFGDFYLSDDYKRWLTDTEFRERYRQLSPNNPYSQDRKYTLREFARLVRGVPGDAAECGCFEGASAWFMATELPDSTLYLFDSFEGLSAPRAEDAAVSTEHFAWREGDLSSPAQKLERNLADCANVVLMPGWIPERFTEVDDRRFRLVHIDVDLYQPTLDSLAFFYPRMSPGGALVFDDYGLTSCPGAYRAIEEYMATRPEHILHLPTGQGVVIKG